MKIFFVILVAVAGFGVCAFSQNAVIKTNENTKLGSQEKCTYWISGVCANEDIGGVEVALGSIFNEDKPWCFHLMFENYNNFTVSVIFECIAEELNRDTNRLEPTKQTGTIVLKANETKETKNVYYNPRNFKLIVRKLNN